MNKSPLKVAKESAKAQGLTFTHSMTTKKRADDVYTVFYNGVEVGTFNVLTASDAKAQYVYSVMASQRVDEIKAVSKALVVHDVQNVANHTARIEAIARANSRADELKLNQSSELVNSNKNTLKSEMTRNTLKLILNEKIKVEANKREFAALLADAAKIREAARIEEMKADALENMKLKEVKKAEQANERAKLKAKAIKSREARQARKLAHNAYLAKKQDRVAPNVKREANLFVDADYICDVESMKPKKSTIFNCFDFAKVFLRSLLIIPAIYIFFVVIVQVVGIDVVQSERACNSRDTGLIMVSLNECKERLGYAGLNYKETNYKRSNKRDLIIKLQKYVPSSLRLSFNNKRKH